MEVIMRHVYLVMITILIAGCKHTGSPTAAEPIGELPGSPESPPDPPSEPLPGDPSWYPDHTVTMDTSEPTFFECEYLALVWESGSGDPAVLYMANQPWASGLFYRVDEDGIILTSSTPLNQNQTYFESDKWVTIGDCEFHIVNSLLGVDIVRWQGVAF